MTWLQTALSILSSIADSVKTWLGMKRDGEIKRFGSLEQENAGMRATIDQATEAKRTEDEVAALGDDALIDELRRRP